MINARFASLAKLMLLAALPVVWSGPSLKAEEIRVTVTNLTSGQTFTPIMAASHQKDVTLFTLGQPASVPLAHLAEAGDNSEIETMLKANSDVLDVQDSGAPLPPGKSVTLTVKAGGGFDHISVAAMLIPTNAGFFALNDEPLSFRNTGEEAGPENKTLTFYAPAYDAGTKADDELCANIPGPPGVCAGTGFINAITGVGFVFIHSGIHGVGDLKPAARDWRNPVAKIEVVRIP